MSDQPRRSAARRIFPAILVLALLLAAAWALLPKPAKPQPLPVSAGGITEKEFFASVASGVHLVDFKAEWCGPCKMQEPILRQLAGGYGGKATLSQIDVDANPDIAERFGINSIPCLILFKNGKETARLVGLQTKAELSQALDAALR